MKEGIPGEKHLGKDHDGWEYTSHDLWRKKMIWKPYWKKIWRTEKKQSKLTLGFPFHFQHVLPRKFKINFRLINSLASREKIGMEGRVDSGLEASQKANLGKEEGTGLEK